MNRLLAAAVIALSIAGATSAPLSAQYANPPMRSEAVSEKDGILKQVGIDFLKDGDLFPTLRIEQFGILVNGEYRNRSIPTAERLNKRLCAGNLHNQVVCRVAVVGGKLHHQLAAWA